MERVDQISEKRYEAFDASSLPLIQHPFSEVQILELQDKFLSEGIHHIKVADIAAGRNLVHTFLDSLTVYHEVACLTVSNAPLESYITNIYHELLLQGYIDQYEARNLEEFFIEQFYFDCLWIECTAELMEQSWFADFQINLLNFKLDRQMPIIMISYGETAE